MNFWKDFRADNTKAIRWKSKERFSGRYYDEELPAKCTDSRGKQNDGGQHLSYRVIWALNILRSGMLQWPSISKFFQRLSNLHKQQIRRKNKYDLCCQQWRFVGEAGSDKQSEFTETFVREMNGLFDCLEVFWKVNINISSHLMSHQSIWRRELLAY